MISIITPHYNGLEYHKEYFKNLFAQTFKEWELLLVDDKSDDDVYNSLRTYAALDKRIVLIRNEENFGVSRSRNIGLSHARFDFVAFLDIDDNWAPNKLQVQLRFMLTDSLDLTATSFSITNDRGRLLRIVRFEGRICHKKIVKFKTIIACSSVMLRVTNKEVRFNESLSHAEDYLLWARLLQDGQFSAKYLDDPNLLYYRQSPGSLSSNKLKQLYGVFWANYLIFDNWIQAFKYTLFYVKNSVIRRF